VPLPDSVWLVTRARQVLSWTSGAPPTRKVLHFLAGMVALVGINVGFIKVIIFLYHQWGALGVMAGLTFFPPILICPIWEWIATGHWITFLFIYGLGFGGFGLCKLCEE